MATYRVKGYVVCDVTVEVSGDWELESEILEAAEKAFDGVKNSADGKSVSVTDEDRTTSICCEELVDFSEIERAD